MRALALQPDGKVLIGGDFSSFGPQIRQSVARLNPDGTLDTSFQNPGVNGNSVFDLVLQPDGKVLIGGAFTTVGGQPRQYVTRLHANGTLDTSFVNPAVNSTVRAFAFQPEGKVVIGGDFSAVGGQTRQGVARLNTRSIKGRRGLRGRVR